MLMVGATMWLSTANLSILGRLGAFAHWTSIDKAPKKSEQRTLNRILDCTTSLHNGAEEPTNARR